MQIFKFSLFLSFLIFIIFVVSRLNIERKFQNVFLVSSQTFDREKSSDIESNVKSILRNLFVEPKLNSKWFTDALLQDVSLEQVESNISFLKKEGGKFSHIKEKEEHRRFRYHVVLEKTIIPVRIVLNNKKNKIAQLSFDNPIRNFKNIKEVKSHFSSLPGEASLLVLKEDYQLIAINSNRKLRVASSFKIAILKALKDKLKIKNQFSWKDMIELKNNLKSLPAGILQDWPEGSVLTIETLAGLMMSLSDNTATDMLINWLGKENIEAQISKDNSPLLTTREFFIIRNNPKLIQRYRNSNKIQKIALLHEIKDYPLPDLEEFSQSLIEPENIDVLGWFFTTQQLCSLIKEVRDVSVMKINSGIINKNDWKQIAYKGGTNQGVLNFTAWLKANNGKSYCVSATWNNSNQFLDKRYFTSLYRGVLEWLIDENN